LGPKRYLNTQINLLFFFLDLRLLEENADISDTRLFSCFLGGHDGSADLLFDQSLMHLFSDLASPIPKNQKV